MVVVLGVTGEDPDVERVRRARAHRDGRAETVALHGLQKYSHRSPTSRSMLTEVAPEQFTKYIVRGLRLVSVALMRPSKPSAVEVSW
jgi:hypothetical protein